MVAVGSGATILPDKVYRPWSLKGQTLKRIDLVEDVAVSFRVDRFGERHRGKDQKAACSVSNLAKYGRVKYSCSRILPSIGTFWYRAVFERPIAVAQSTR